MTYQAPTTSLRPKSRPTTVSSSPRPPSRSTRQPSTPKDNSSFGSFVSPTNTGSGGLASPTKPKKQEEKPSMVDRFWSLFDSTGGTVPEDDTTSSSERALSFYDSVDMTIPEVPQVSPTSELAPATTDPYVGAVGTGNRDVAPNTMDSYLQGDADIEAVMPPSSGLMSRTLQEDTDAAVAEVVEETTDTTPTRDELIDSVFEAEGGYSTDRNDTGNYYRGQFVGTNHGISAPVLADHLGRTPTVQDMRNLTQDTARDIAATQYYDNYNISDLPDDTQEIVFHAVYMGGSRGVRAVQNLTGSTPDGVMGPNTRTAMQEATFTPQEYRDEYLRELEFGTTGYSDPAGTWDDHGRGWTNRYNDLAGD